MNLDPFLILTFFGEMFLRVGIVAAFVTVGVTGLLVGLIALGARRVRRRWADAEEECEGLASFTWNEPE
ncbi:hypothetical protein [Streptomyces sp. NPDC005408]|uniref:hypothetical protein n=1 Tax=Streptomyces sp. NPDC005408 TaxID=3155341 RepID=UPI0033B2AEB5